MERGLFLELQELTMCLKIKKELKQCEFIYARLQGWLKLCNWNNLSAKYTHHNMTRDRRAFRIPLLDIRMY